MRHESIPRVLKEYRKKNNLSVKEVSRQLLDYSFEVAPKTIYGWESGQANPSSDMFLTLCELYSISDVMGAFGCQDQNAPFHVSPSERALIESYRKHPDMQKAVNKLLDVRRRPPISNA